MKAIACLLLALGAVPAASGASLVWTNTAGGAWHTAANWSPNQVPTGADDVSITTAGTYTVSLHSPAVARSITVGADSGAQVLNMPSGSLTVSNSITIGPSGLLQALGTLNVFGDVAVNGEFQALGVVLGGSGAVDVAGGRLRLISDLRISNRVVRNGGTVTISGGSRLLLGDNTWFTNLVAGTLVFTNDNSGIQYNGNFPNTNQFVANLGTIRAHGNATFIDVPGAHNGTIEVTGGEFQLRRNPNFSSFALDVTGVCNIAAGASLAFENAATEFRPLASAVGGGNLRVSGGTFHLTGAYNLGGTLICQNNAVVHLDTGAPLALPHLVNEQLADVRGSDPLTITGTLVWRHGAKFSGPAPLALAQTCQSTLEGGGLQMNRPFMANAGAMNWVSSDLRLATNSVFTNLSTGAIVITTNATGVEFTYIRPVGAPGATCHNEGLVRVDSVTATECYVPFFNTGTVRAERGEFRLAGNAPFVQEAGATELAGGNLFAFDGSSYQFLGGALTGAGSIIGAAVTNVGALVSPGTSPGQLHVSFRPGTASGGRYEQQAGGTLDIELAGTVPGTEFDQLVVDGSVTLDGTLNVTLANGFIPPPGSRFLIVSAATRTGQFRAFHYPSNQVELQLAYRTNGVELVVGGVAEEIFLVRNLNDSGPGSLRAAVGAAGGGASPLRKVHFAITNPPPYTITLLSPVTVLDRILVDGTTQPGFAGAPVVTVRGAPDVVGVRFWGSNSIVRGLAFTDFTRPALQFGEPGFAFGNANAVEGCYFGVDATGTNVTGIALSDAQYRAHVVCHSDGNRIGGANAAARNLFTGHNGAGVMLFGQSNVVQGNLFGTDITGTNRLGQLAQGVAYRGLSARVGGPEPGAGNVFAFLGFEGVSVEPGKERCTVRGNSMFANGSLGIVIGASENDPGDGDNFLVGNQGQNFPVLTSVFNLPEGTVISGTLNSHSNASFTLDFYANTECDPAGHGEGKRYLGFTQVTTDASGNASFNFTPTMGSPTLEASEIVTATATDAAGNTSEFSECSGIASSIGGQIVESDTPLSGASIRLSGFRSGTTSSDAFGNFTFPGLPAFGAYTIVPSKPGYVFTPQSRSFTNLATPGVANFSGAVGTYSISGAVRDPAGNAIAGARVTLRGGTNAIFVTDLRGGYAFTKLPGLTDYTLSVSKPDFAFGPPTNVNNLVANRTVNFTGTPPPRTVTGHVRTSGGQPVPGVTVQASPISLFVPGPVFGSAPTDAQGAYQLANLPSNQRYIVRPSSSQFIFTPSSLLLHLTDTDLTADFTATPGHRISGRVTEGSAPWAGLPVHFTELAADGNHSRGSAITDANGDYQSPLLPEGRDYEVRPASPFVPAPRTPEKLVVLNLPFDVSGQDFSGSRDRFQVSGVVISDAGLAVPGVFVTLTNEVGAQSTNEAVYGAFSSLSPGGLNYTISPSRQGFIFTPSNIVINLTNDLHVEFHGRPVMALTGRIGFLDEIPLVMNADSTGAASENAVVTAEEFIVPCEGVSVECGVFDVEDFLDFGGSSVISSSEYLAVALSPDSRQFAFIERTTFSTFRVGDVIPTTEVRGRLVKWDVDRLSPPVELATGTFLPRVSWSANGARIAFARPANPDDPQGLYVISANGGAGTVHTFPGEPRDPALSPDGNRLAFAAQFNGQYEIYLMNVNGTGLQRLTFNPDDDLEPAWSPDGRTIACASKRGGDFEIVIVDEMTGQELVLTSNSVDDREPAWSPDGERIAFTRNGIIHVTSISGSPAVIALRRGTSPSWGADPTYATPASATLGQDVTVNAGSIDVTFNGVTSPGETTVAAIAPIADATALPEGYFALMGTDTAFEISTTAGVLAPITVCLHVERISDEAFFNGLVILHHENGNLVDITVSHDFATRSICGSANSLSPFRLAVRVDPARPLLQGTVVDTHGAGVSDVLIALGGDTTLATSTDFAGRFTLGNLTHAGNYTVTPIHPAYNFVPPSAFVQNLTGTNALVFTAVPTASPQLRIAYDPQNPGAFTLAWPIDAWPFGLEAADSLTSLKWTPVTVPLAIVGNDFVIKLATAGPARYFRLRRP